MTKNKLYWVSVGGNPCEPARLVEFDNAKVIFTIGCPDGTKFEDGCGIELVEEIEKHSIPLTPEGAKRAETNWRRKLARDRKNNVYHGYRRFT